mmetsp:Transcript_4615/g.15465  ORF Transcript_4615/g.15465 Transcript_4615/m.15465 type:complete len:212 (+) Transcript_4615:147-782(+)
MRRWPGYASRCTERGPSRTSLRRMEGETCQTSGWGIGSCLDQLCRMGCSKGRPDSGDPSRDLRKMATAEDAADRRCLVLSDCKPALQQIEAAYRKGSLEGLREWDRGGILEGICRYRAQLESVTFLWVPSHAGCASNAYADAAATAYMGASEIEDATAVIREAVSVRSRVLGRSPAHYPPTSRCRRRKCNWSLPYSRKVGRVCSSWEISCT